jgi:hypothetical protein
MATSKIPTLAEEHLLSGDLRLIYLQVSLLCRTGLVQQLRFDRMAEGKDSAAKSQRTANSDGVT